MYLGRERTKNDLKKQEKGEEEDDTMTRHMTMVSPVPVMHITSETFSPEEREDSNKRWAIPENQRFCQGWKLHMKQDLIDSIDKGYPIPLIQTTKREVTDRTSWVQDGQTRLSIILDYKMNKFCDNNGKLYKSTGENGMNMYRTSEERERFDAYNLWIAETTFIGYTLEETYKLESEMFARLNSGKQLTDNEKYHNKKSKSAVNHVYEMAKEQRVIKYCGNVGKGKTFAGLADMVGATVSIGKRDKSRCTKSYDINSRYLDLTREELERATMFFKEYFDVLEEVYTGKHKANFGQLSKVLCMAVYNYIDNGGWDVIQWCFEQLKGDEKYLDTLFNNLQKGDKRNMKESNITARLNRLWEAFNESGSSETSGSESE